MSAHRAALDEYKALAIHTYEVPDPGDTGTIDCAGKGKTICKVTSAGAETRVLSAATDLPLGARCVVLVDVVTTSVTVESDDSDLVLNGDGDAGEFIVASNAGTKEWRLCWSNT